MAEEIRNITEEDIKRINELYHKSKSEVGLTPDEQEEQAKLRHDYIMAIRRNLRGTLNSIDLVDENGNVTSLEKKHGEKNV